MYLLDYGVAIDHPVSYFLRLCLPALQIDIIFLRRYSDQSQEFDAVRGTEEYLFPGPNPATVPMDQHGHGTCMMSKITGKQTGVSKFVKPVITVLDLPTL